MIQMKQSEKGKAQIYCEKCKLIQPPIWWLSAHNSDVCNVTRGCKSRKGLGTTTFNSCKALHSSTFSWPHKWDFYRADSADAGPVRLLVHSGCLVDLTEEEVDLLLVLLWGRNYGCTGKLWICWWDSIEISSVYLQDISWVNQYRLLL